MKRINFLFFVILLIPLLSSGQEIYTISGIITDSISGETLENIDIVVENKLTGTISNVQGAYILYMPEGQYYVRYSAKGFVKQTVEIKLNNNRVQMVEMSPKSTVLRNKNQNNKPFAFLKRKQAEELLSDNLN